MSEQSKSMKEQKKEQRARFFGRKPLTIHKKKQFDLIMNFYNVFFFKLMSFLVGGVIRELYDRESICDLGWISKLSF